MSQQVSAVVAIVALVVVLLAVIWTAQRRLIYFPSAILPSPADVGLTDAEAVTFPTSDGLQLGAWFVPGSGAAPRPAVLVFNGNAGNRAYRAPLAASLRRHGLHVLLTDYRGYGGNPGTPSEYGLADDAWAALGYLLSRPDVDHSRIVYFGESLGAAVAVRLAVDDTPAGLILRSPFTSLADIGRHHYPLLPVGLLLRDRFASIDSAHLIQSPVLMIAGDRDRVVPIAYTRRLFAAVGAPKTFVEIAGADHNDYELLAGNEMIESILQFVRPL